MFTPSFQELKEKGGNRYTLSLFLSKRARELTAGDEPLISTKSKRAVSIALEELFAGKITPTDTEIITQDKEEEPSKIIQVLDDDDYYEEDSDYSYEEYDKPVENEEEPLEDSLYGDDDYSEDDDLRDDWEEEEE